MGGEKKVENRVAWVKLEPISILCSGMVKQSRPWIARTHHPIQTMYASHSLIPSLRDRTRVSHSQNALTTAAISIRWRELGRVRVKRYGVEYQWESRVVAGRGLSCIAHL